MGIYRDGRGEVDLASAVDPDFSLGNTEQLADIVDTAQRLPHHLSFYTTGLSIFDMDGCCGENAGNDEHAGSGYM